MTLQELKEIIDKAADHNPDLTVVVLHEDENVPDVDTIVGNVDTAEINYRGGPTVFCIRIENTSGRKAYDVGYGAGYADGCDKGFDKGYKAARLA